VHVVVDNSAGGDQQFADQVAQGLRERGIEVEMRTPRADAMLDTAVHLVTAGMVIRLEERPPRAELETIEEVVRASLQHRPSLRRRTRSVPVHLGETRRVLEWIDVFD
jgi:predicted amino acid racemase